MSLRVAALVITIISTFNNLRARGDASAPNARPAIPKCARKRDALDLSFVLAYRSFGVIATDFESYNPSRRWTIRGRLIFASGDCTAGMPPYCVGELALVQLPSDPAGYIALDARRAGLPLRCGVTEAADGRPGATDCGPLDLLDHDVEVRGYFTSRTPSMIVESLCRR